MTNKYLGVPVDCDSICGTGRVTPEAAARIVAAGGAVRKSEAGGKYEGMDNFAMTRPIAGIRVRREVIHLLSGGMTVTPVVECDDDDDNDDALNGRR